MLYRFKIITFWCVAFFSQYSSAQLELDNQVVMQSDPDHKTVWVLQSPQGFTLAKLDTKKGMTHSQESDLKIAIAAGKIYCNGKRVSTNHLRIVPCSGSLSFDGKPYVGSFIIRKNNRQYVLIHQSAEHTQSSNAAEDRLKITPSTIKNSKNKARDFTIKVLLDSKSDLRLEPWILESKQGFYIAELADNNQRKKISQSKLYITVKRDGTIYLNNKPTHRKQVMIQPCGAATTFNNDEYQGAFWIIVDDDEAKIINGIGLEEYVQSVLCTESWPGWPLEVNKALAITSRTYVIAMVQRAKKSNCLYHVRNTNKHQTYRGGVASSVVQQAVQDTQGVFIAYDNHPIIAMFDSCCGGIVPAKTVGYDFDKAPYLGRKYACRFCASCKMHSWKASYEAEEFVALLKSEGMHIRRIKDVKVTKKDKAGVVQEILIKGIPHNYYLTGKKLYSLSNKKMRSLSCKIEKQGNAVIVQGVGVGHQMGLCQWGAREMIRQGYDYKEVLMFYYPGTQLMRLV